MRYIVSYFNSGDSKRLIYQLILKSANNAEIIGHMINLWRKKNTIALLISEQYGKR